MSSTQLSIKRWSAWMPGIDTREDWQAWRQGLRQPLAGENPSVQEIPPMLRRRLSPLGKMALSVAWPLLSASMPSVFCSRHGELERTVGMLQNLAAGEALSPTHFSLSVHNAIGGVFSIARADSSAISALAIGPQGFSNALLEARLILAEQQVPEVLCVVYDAPLPEVYSDFGRDPEWPYAVAFVVGPPESAAADCPLLELSLESGSSTPEGAEIGCGETPQALGFLALLLEPESRELWLPYRQDFWRWRRLECEQR